MAVQTITATGTGATAAVAINLSSFGSAYPNAPLLSGSSVPASQGIGLLFNIPSGTTANADVQVSGNVNGPWNNHDTMFGMTTNKNGSIVFPIAYVRLNVNSIIGSGTLTLFVIQPGSN